MGLLGTTTAEQYYTISQKFTATASQTDFVLTVSDLPVDETEIIVFANGTEVDKDDYTFPKAATTDTIEFNSGRTSGDIILVKFIDRSLGDYRYIKLVDIVNNFIYGFTGEGKVLNKVRRSDVIFQAKRGIQEFAYDISKIEKIQEVDVPPTLTLPMPQDYVQYTMLSWVDTKGLEHPIFPATNITTRPSESIAQDSNGDYLFDNDGSTTLTTPSLTQTRFKDFNLDAFNQNTNNDDYWLYTHYLSNRVNDDSGRYGIDPTRANMNGLFIVDEANGQFGFSSDMADRTVIIKYISDGLATDAEMKVSKLAEDALYKYIYHGILSTKLGIPEYQIARARKDRRAAMRNAKIRLYNMNSHEIINAMRGKNKHIKH